MVEPKPLPGAAAVPPAPISPAVAAPAPPAGPSFPPINPAEVTQAIINDPAVKKAMEVFGARIIHVEPRRK